MKLASLLLTVATLAALPHACTNSFARSSTQRAEIATQGVVLVTPPSPQADARTTPRAVTDSSIVKRGARPHTSGVAAAHGGDRRRSTGQLSAAQSGVASADLSGVPAESDARSRARSGSAGQSFDDALTLAQASYLETGFSIADGKALAGVMRSRSRSLGISLAGAAYSYTAIGRGFGVERNDHARTLPDGDVDGWSSKTNARWKRLRAAVRAVVERRAGSPCRGADHLGSRTLPTDVRRAERAIREGRWRKVECAAEVVHAYYAVVR